MAAAQTPSATDVRGAAMAAASRGEDTTSKGRSHAVIRAPPTTAPAVEPVAVANTLCNDDTVAALESVGFGFTTLPTVPHNGAVNGAPLGLAGPLQLCRCNAVRRPRHRQAYPAGR